MDRVWCKYATVTEMVRPRTGSVDRMRMECCLVDVIEGKGMSTEEVADSAGISVGILARIDEGDFLALRKSTLTRLCEVLDCQVGDILKMVDG